ncbi:MAG: hypothetical protein KC434_15520 [Anaerolineales bacterium]|nr:hypothetical protein [Anaerolineales bacterium]
MAKQSRQQRLGAVGSGPARQMHRGVWVSHQLLPGGSTAVTGPGHFTL